MEKLKILRKNANKTQQDIATYLGISYQAYAGYESGRREPDFATISKLADYFGVSVDYLIGREEQQKKPTGEPVSFERLSGILKEKGMSEKDIENLSKEQLSTIADIIKNFKQ